MDFHFVATGCFDATSYSTLESFVDSYPDFQTVWLRDEYELDLLLGLMGITGLTGADTNSKVFDKYWDLSNFKLPELNNEQFDQFYSDWIQASNRENNMDEYGNLVFLQGLSSKWNKLRYRFVFKESSDNI